MEATIGERHPSEPWRIYGASDLVKDTPAKEDVYDELHWLIAEGVISGRIARIVLDEIRGREDAKDGTLVRKIAFDEMGLMPC